MKYVVALAVGGVMEQPEFTYHDKQIIEADSPKQAEEIYNQKNNCSYFYAECLGEALEENGEFYFKEEIKNN